MQIIVYKMLVNVNKSNIKSKGGAEFGTTFCNLVRGVRPANSCLQIEKSEIERLALGRKSRNCR